MVNYLYLHIPFCRKKCLYCDFNSLPFDSNLADRYVFAICKEIVSQSPIIGGLKSIYIGGGTPTILQDGALLNIMQTIRENYGIDRDAEITVEANPESINQQKTEEILRAGINRISIGVQSLDDNDLLILGRSHTASEALEAINIIKRAGFHNISIDLIYGIPKKADSRVPPERDLESWQISLIKTIELNPQHISIYELTPEFYTPLYNEIQSERILMPDEDVVSEMYYRTMEILEGSGYLHYEISNFAKPEYECIHNLNYWEAGEYIGLGAGAHSFSGGVRYSNVRNINDYITAIEDGLNPVIENIESTPEERLKELIFLGLRKVKGFDIKKMPADRLKRMQPVINDLIEYGVLIEEGEFLRLSKKGLILSSEVMVRLMSVL